MTVTEKLLQVFRVDLQLRGLQTRLTAAESFLVQQNKQISQIDTQRNALESQLRQLKASLADAEGEVARLDERAAKLREQMNAAGTNKEYQAFLNELKGLEQQKGEAESQALEHMTKVEELTAELDQLNTSRGERDAMQSVALQDRDARAAEIKDRLAELTAERSALAKDAPDDALRTLEKLLARMGDEAMAPVQIEDKRRMEFSCGSCMMSIPIELVSTLLSRGDVTTCASCGAILYLAEDVHDLMASKK